MVECIILVGLQGAGKTTFYRRYFAESHVHVSMDRFPNARRKAARAALELSRALDAGRSVVVDNTNPSIAVRAPLIRMARARGATVIGYYVEATMEEALRRNRLRQGRARVPDVGVFATAKRLELPARAEGFHRLHRARVDGDGSFAIEDWTGDLGRFREGPAVDGLERCRLYVPPGYERGGAPWPLLVFLHADAESGRDNLSQLSVGLGPTVLRHPDRWPFVVAFPQKPDGATPWMAHRDALATLVERLDAMYGIDPERCYLTGVREGGDATRELGAARPDDWTALAPVSGVDPVSAVRATPIWLFDGEAGSVLPSGSAGILHVRGERVRLTRDESSTVDDIGTEEPDLPLWFLRYDRRSAR